MIGTYAYLKCIWFSLQHSAHSLINANTHSVVEFKATFLSFFVLKNTGLAQVAAMFSIFSLGELE